MGPPSIIFSDISSSGCLPDLHLMPSRSPPDASPKGIHQAVNDLRGQISAGSASPGLIFDFPGFSSSGDGSRHGAV